MEIVQVGAADFARLRRDYSLHSLSEKEVNPDPFVQFKHWLDDAIEIGEPEPNAMSLATATVDGKPSVRVLLMKGVDSNGGLTFYTNYDGRKGHELAQNPLAAAVFHWHRLERQVRIEGSVAQIPDTESDEYFFSRPREAQISAWASRQSTTIPSQEFLQETVRSLQERFSNEEITRPPFWGGYKLKPDSMEFWQGRPSRLHDRILYTRNEDNWTIERLAP